MTTPFEPGDLVEFIEDYGVAKVGDRFTVTEVDASVWPSDPLVTLDGGLGAFARRLRKAEAPTLAVGDRVVVMTEALLYVPGDKYPDEATRGDVGTVTRTVGTLRDHSQYGVKWDHSGKDSVVWDGCLAAYVEPEPEAQYAVGDKVVVQAGPTYFDGVGQTVSVTASSRVGDVVEVIHLYPDGDLRVQHEDGVRFAITPGSVKPSHPEPESLDYAVGDRVVVTSPIYRLNGETRAERERFLGQAGTVEGKPDQDGDYRVRLDGGGVARIDPAGLVREPEPALAEWERELLGLNDEPKPHVYTVGDLAVVGEDPHWSPYEGGVRPCTLGTVKAGDLVKVTAYDDIVAGNVIVQRYPGSDGAQVIRTADLTPYAAPVVELGNTHVIEEDGSIAAPVVTLDEANVEPYLAAIEDWQRAYSRHIWSAPRRNGKAYAAQLAAEVDPAPTSSARADALRTAAEVLALLPVPVSGVDGEETVGMLVDLADYILGLEA